MELEHGQDLDQDRNVDFEAEPRETAEHLRGDHFEMEGIAFQDDAKADDCIEALAELTNEMMRGERQLEYAGQRVLGHR